MPEQTYHLKRKRIREGRKMERRRKEEREKIALEVVETMT